jgi:pyridoxamine 5'-phosphate oxidase
LTSTAIAEIRKEYKLQTLSEKDVLQDPFAQFEKWWREALHAGIDEPNAMTLATAATDGVPDARIVLLKGFDSRGFTFFTNYDSAKGRQLLANPRAALVFFWAALERQVRINGQVYMAGPEISDEYFNSRPEGSRIGAWASPQSQVIESREWLEKKEMDYRTASAKQPLARPPYWGGYVVRPERMEFWQGRPSRLHDRLLFSLQHDGSWKVQRLAP